MLYAKIFKQEVRILTWRDRREKQLAIVTQSVARHAARSRVRQEQKNKSNQQHVRVLRFIDRTQTITKSYKIV